MPHEPLRAALHHLRRVLGTSQEAGVGDAQLMERFVTARDEAAFELLIRRHERLVLNVCRRVLHDSHAAEDAFQATFLVFVRKAASIGKRASVACWLYKVAYRVAVRARAQAARRAAHEKLGADLPALAAGPGPSVARRELGPVLDQEVSRLPEKYRLPVVLCYLESRTYEEAARELGCSRGTVSTRLTRARALLRRRLARRGLALPGALLAFRLVDRSTSAALAAGRAEAIVRAAATGTLSPSVRSLTEGALHAMFLTKIKQFAAGTVLALTVVGLGTGVLVYRPAAAQQPGADSRAAADDPPRDEPRRSGLDLSIQPQPAPKLEREAAPAAPPDGWVARPPLPTGTKRSMAVAFSPDGRHLAAGGLDGAVTLWDVATGKEISRFLFAEPVYTLAFTPDGKMLATGGSGRDQDGAVLLWDVSAWRQAAVLKQVGVVALAVSPDGTHLAAASRNGAAVLWSLRGHKARAEIKGHAATVFSVAFSPDGKVLATAGGEEFPGAGKSAGELELWDIPTGRLLARIGGHTAAVSAVAFSPDGRTLVSGGLDGGVRLWDVPSGKELRRLEGHGRGVRTVTLSPDGRTLVSGDLGGAVKVWDLRSGRLLAVLRGPGDGVMSVAFSPDGRLLAAAGGSDTAGQVLVWGVRAAAAATPPGPARGPVGRLDRLLDELQKSGRSDDQIVEALYLATLARLPTEAERKPILEHLRQKGRREAFRDTLWALVNSREFAANLREWSQMNPGDLREFLKALNEQGP